jgi:hypothetical protein
MPKDDTAVLLNGGPDNGNYYFSVEPVSEGEVISYPEGDYVIERWPEGFVALWQEDYDEFE